MRCEILLFAQLADMIGTDRLAISLPEGATVADALAKVANDHEAIASVRSTLAVAVNERYCSPHSPLSDGDTIALIPPVSGG